MDDVRCCLDRTRYCGVSRGCPVFRMEHSLSDTELEEYFIQKKQRNVSVNVLDFGRCVYIYMKICMLHSIEVRFSSFTGMSETSCTSKPSSMFFLSF